MFLPIILSGGSGSRLWPLSRSLYPKQYLSIIDDETMLQKTISRLEGIEHQPPLIVCNNDHRFTVAEQLRRGSLASSGIILEPMGKNTAPAVALAALHAVSQGEDPTILILSADHSIQNETAFKASIEKALPLAEEGRLVTFGIKPNKPETGYGYIKQGNAVGSHAFDVDAFVEKPNFEVALEYVESGEYTWNSGMFMFKASVFLAELKRFREDIFAACERTYASVFSDLDFLRVSPELFAECPGESIDYAVMEKTDNAVVVPIDIGWNDVGSWSAIWDVNDKDDEGNSLRGDVLTENTSNSYVYSQSKLVATVGVSDLVVIETKDAVLVAAKDKVQDVKSIVDKLKASGRTEHIQHREVSRPWGTHDSIAEGPRYQVKLVEVKPGGKTSIQKHFHRSEHWVVVSGTAKVLRGDEELIVTENQSIYMPIGETHAIENPGSIPLKVIEIRTGSHLGEDDVVRLDKDGYPTVEGDYH